MDILLVNPAVTETNKGNHVTSNRWKNHLEILGHHVSIHHTYTDGDWDCLLALHAYKSAGAVEEFTKNHPDARVILAMTGTDLYRDLDSRPEVRASLDIADDVILLQPLAREKLPETYRDRSHVIYQSVPDVPSTGQQPDSHPGGPIALSVAHLRSVKDPLRLAHALQDVPDSSSLRGYHLGGILDEDYREKLESLEDTERFEYLGERPRTETLRYIMGANVLVVSSRLEGGANVVSEAIACGTPILASDIPGNRGLLGTDYPGYFPVEGTESLRDLLLKCENEPEFYARLEEHITSIKHRFLPEHERAQWEDVLQS